MRENDSSIPEVTTTDVEAIKPVEKTTRRSRVAAFFMRSVFGERQQRTAEQETSQATFEPLNLFGSELKESKRDAKVGRFSKLWRAFFPQVAEKDVLPKLDSPVTSSPVEVPTEMSVSVPEIAPVPSRESVDNGTTISGKSEVLTDAPLQEEASEINEVEPSNVKAQETDAPLNVENSLLETTERITELASETTQEKPAIEHERFRTPLEMGSSVVFKEPTYREKIEEDWRDKEVKKLKRQQKRTKFEVRKLKKLIQRTAPKKTKPAQSLSHLANSPVTSPELKAVPRVAQIDKQQPVQAYKTERKPYYEQRPITNLFEEAKSNPERPVGRSKESIKKAEQVVRKIVSPERATPLVRSVPEIDNRPEQVVERLTKVTELESQREKPLELVYERSHEVRHDTVHGNSLEEMGKRALVGSIVGPNWPQNQSAQNSHESAKETASAKLTPKKNSQVAYSAAKTGVWAAVVVVLFTLIAYVLMR